MNEKLLQTAQQALEAFEALKMIAGESLCADNLISDKDIARAALAALRAAITALRAQLAQPEQKCEPLTDQEMRKIADQHLIRQAAQRALKALETVRDYRIEENLHDEIIAIRNALAKQPSEQEPLMQPDGRCRWCLTYNGHQDGCPDAPQPAKPAEQQREWQALTDEELLEILKSTVAPWVYINCFSNAVEKKLKEKNTRYTTIKLLSLLFTKRK